MPFNVWLLMAAQGLNQSGITMVMLVGGLIGSRLAPSPLLVTVPVACAVVGTALATVPVALSMQRWGRKAVFLGGMLCAIVGSLVAALGIQLASFALFCGAVALLGGSVAVGMQYRFAAMEMVPVALAPQAASRLLLAGLLAAVLGPELGAAGRHLLPAEYGGSFLGLACLQLLGLVFLLFYREGGHLQRSHAGGGRPFRAIMGHSVFWVAIMSAAISYAVMSFVMVATPVSMHVHHGHTVIDAKWVIQTHMLAMFLPSLFSGWLIARFGAASLILTGCVLFLLCVGIGFSGGLLGNFHAALILLGVAWNFMFVSGTALLPSAHRHEERFRVQGLNEFVVFGAQAVAALSSGWVLAAIGWKALLLLCVPMVGLQLALLWLWRRNA